MKQSTTTYNLRINIYMKEQMALKSEVPKNPSHQVSIQEKMHTG